MKKLLLIVALLANIGLITAQNYAEISITDNIQPEYGYCANTYDGVIIHGVPGCNMNVWYVNGEQLVSESIVVYSYNQNQLYSVDHEGCNLWVSFVVYFEFSLISNPFDEPIIWKHPDETITIGRDLGHTDISYIWNTGETTATINVNIPGIYTVTITDICGSETFSVEIRDNVEISLATCDLETNHNMVTWPVTAAQAQYIDHLRVIRDGMEVGTANYSDGFFLDAIGSDAASRTYTLIAVATDGTECPIVSYPKETIHMAYLTGINNTIEVNWNVPTGYDLLGYNICEWHPGSKDGDLTVIDYVGAGVTSYTCSESMFDQGNVVIQGVEAGKSESRLLSNRSWETVGLGEYQNKAFKLYPNPSNGEFTVDGANDLTVINTLGQIVARSHSESGIHHISLSVAPGTYFVKGGGSTQKVVVIPE